MLEVVSSPRSRWLPIPLGKIAEVTDQAAGLAIVSRCWFVSLSSLHASPTPARQQHSSPALLLGWASCFPRTCRTSGGASRARLRLPLCPVRPVSDSPRPATPKPITDGASREKTNYQEGSDETGRCPVLLPTSILACWHNTLTGLRTSSDFPLWP